jgi:hypothetical protein
MKAKYFSKLSYIYFFGHEISILISFLTQQKENELEHELNGHFNF